jgi:hypothetical protein
MKTPDGNEPKGRMEKVNIADLKPGPIQHKSLPDKLLKNIRTLYEMVGHYSCSTLEEWEIGFMRDTRPEREVAVWSRVALAWMKYHKLYLNNKILSDDKESDLVNVLVSFSLGANDNPLEELVGKDIVVKLKECYANPTND